MARRKFISDDNQRIARAMAGDRIEFDELVLRHRPRVYRYCLGMLEHTQDAEDMTSDTFLRAWIKRHTYRPEAATTFEAWLLAIARNLCRTFLEERRRRQGIQAQRESASPDGIPDSSAAQLTASSRDPRWISLKDALSREMDLLPAAWRTAFTMMLDGRSYQEIADSMGMTINYVGVLINRARRRLQRRLASRVEGLANQFMIGNRCARSSAVWGELETRLRGIVSDFKLVTVPLNGRGASLQIWVPVLDISWQQTFQEALDRLRRKTRENPKDQDSWVQLAEMCRAQGDIQQAIAGYRRALQGTIGRNGCGQDRMTPIRIRLGECLRLVERRAEATEAFRGALRRLRDPGERFLVQGHLHSLRRNHRKAVVCYESALRHIKGKYANATSDDTVSILIPIRHYLAIAYRADGRPDLAVREYEAIIRADPCDVDACDRVADCYRELGAWDKTLGALEKAAEIMPHCPRTLRHLAQKLVDTQHQLDRALALAERAVHLAPDHWECWKTLGQVYRCLGRMPDARRAYDKSIEVGRKLADAWWHYSSFMENLGDWDAVLRAALRARRLERDNPLRMICLADVHLKCGSRRAAVLWTDRASEIEPKGWFLSIGIADLYCRLGQREQALKWARRAIRETSSPFAHSNLGRVHSTFGEWKESAAALERSVSQPTPTALPVCYWNYVHLARCYEGLGDQRRRRSALRNAIQCARRLLALGHADPDFQLALSAAESMMRTQGVAGKSLPRGEVVQV